VIDLLSKSIQQAAPLQEYIVADQIDALAKYQPNDRRYIVVESLTADRIRDMSDPSAKDLTAGPSTGGQAPAGGGGGGPSPFGGGGSPFRGEGDFSRGGAFGGGRPSGAPAAVAAPGGAIGLAQGGKEQGFKIVLNGRCPIGKEAKSNVLAMLNDLIKASKDLSGPTEAELRKMSVEELRTFARARNIQSDPAASVDDLVGLVLKWRGPRTFEVVDAKIITVDAIEETGTPGSPSPAGRPTGGRSVGEGEFGAGKSFGGAAGARATTQPDQTPKDITGRPINKGTIFTVVWIVKVNGDGLPPPAQPASTASN
jgi:hypothetical protein